MRRVALGTQRRHHPKPRLVQCAGDQLIWLQTCGQPDLRQGSRFIPKTLRVLETLRVWPFASWSALYTRPPRFDTAQMFGYNTYLFRTVVLRLTTSPLCAEWANATQRQESTQNYRISLRIPTGSHRQQRGVCSPCWGPTSPKEGRVRLAKVWDAPFVFAPAWVYSVSLAPDPVPGSGYAPRVMHQGFCSTPPWIQIRVFEDHFGGKYARGGSPDAHQWTAGTGVPA